MAAGVETERCVLREIDPVADARALYEMNLDREVLKWVGDDPFESEDATRAFYETYCREVYPTGFGRWSVIEKRTGTFLGWCGLKLVDAVKGEVDLGYRFAREHWGKGYATETARASLEWGFRVRELARVVAWVHPENAASIRVLEKLAFRHVGEKMIGVHRVLSWERRR